MSLNVLVVSKGHDFAHDAFLAMFAAMDGIAVTLAQHPAAAMALAPDNLPAWDAVLFYDMCGIPGLPDPAGADAQGRPPARYQATIEALLDAGKGLVLLNHATVSWPNWPLWRHISGSPFMLSAGELHGKRVPGSGYRGGHGPLDNATVRLDPAGDHPVLAGLETGFEITDELYLKTAEFEPSVLPLLRADYPFVAENFTPPPLASKAEQAQWQHPPGSNLVAWANACRNSPVFASDLGDAPAAYGNPGFRRLLANALRWVASAEASAWAAKQRRGETR